MNNIHLGYRAHFTYLTRNSTSYRISGLGIWAVRGHVSVAHTVRPSEQHRVVEGPATRIEGSLRTRNKAERQRTGIEINGSEKRAVTSRRAQP